MACGCKNKQNKVAPKTQPKKPTSPRLNGVVNGRIEKRIIR